MRRPQSSRSHVWDRRGQPAGRLLHGQSLPPERGGVSRRGGRVPAARRTLPAPPPPPSRAASSCAGGAGADAQGRRHHGCGDARGGAHRRGGRRRGGDGPGARARRHSPPGRRRAHVRPPGARCARLRMPVLLVAAPRPLSTSHACPLALGRRWSRRSSAQSPSPSWPRPASGTLWRRRFWRPAASTTLMRARHDGQKGQGGGDVAAHPPPTLSPPPARAGAHAR